MIITETPSEAAPTTPTTAESRGTSFVPVQGSQETSGGTDLVIAAYALIWALTFVWLVTMFRKQASLRSKVDALEAQIARALAKAENSHGPTGS